MLWLQEQCSHWKIYIILIITVGVLIADRVLRWYLLKHPPFVISTEFWGLPLRLLLVMLWATAVWSVLIKVYYHDKTGRDYFEDRRNSRLGLFKLIQFYSLSDPYRMNEHNLPLLNWKEADGIVFGHSGQRLVYRNISEDRGEGVNVIVCGRPGSNKTTAGVIPTCMRFGACDTSGTNFDGAVLAIDIKGDILHAVGNRRNIKVFAPYDCSNSAHYDPLHSIRHVSAYDRSIFLEQMASVLIPADGTESGRYYDEGARNFYVGISVFLLKQDSQISFSEICNQVVLGNAQKWLDNIDKSEDMTAQRYVRNYQGNVEKNINGIYSELSKRLRPFSCGSIAEVLTDDGDCITPQILEDGSDIYIEVPQESLSAESTSSLLSMLVSDFATAFMKRPDISVDSSQRSILFMLDEFGQLYLPEIVSFCETLRSRKVSLYLVVQSLSTLEAKYGARKSEIIDCMRYFVIMSAQDVATREFFQKLLGMRKILKQSYSESLGIGQYNTKKDSGSGSQSESESEEYIFKQEDFSNLGKKLIVYADGNYILCDKCYSYK